MPESDYFVKFGTNAAETLSSGSRTSDFLHGGGGRDTLKGGDKQDMLVDGGGVDRMFGGKGDDVFSFVKDGKRDKVMDYEDGSDRIDLSRLGVEGFRDVVVVQKSGGVLLKAAGEKIVLVGADKGDIDADDFIFADRVAIGFDDLASDGGSFGYLDEINDDGTYGGFEFHRLAFYETDESSHSHSGYVPASGDNVVYNTYGANSSVARDMPFDLEQAWFSAGWRDGLTVVAVAYLGDEYLGMQQFQVDVGAPVRIDFDDDIFDYVTRVEFNAFGGTPLAATDFDWNQFSMDDLLLLG